MHRASTSPHTHTHMVSTQKRHWGGRQERKEERGGERNESEVIIQRERVRYISESGAWKHTHKDTHIKKKHSGDAHKQVHTGLFPLLRSKGQQVQELFTTEKEREILAMPLWNMISLVVKLVPTCSVHACIHHLISISFMSKYFKYSLYCFPKNRVKCSHLTIFGVFIYN